MIYFQSDTFKIDITGFGVKTKEENSIFSDNIYQSYSLPFVIPADSDLVAKLGLPNLDNIKDLDTAIKGRIVLPLKHYNATFHLGEVNKNYIECKITYGENQLPVYDTELKDLPWPLEIKPNLALRAFSMTYDGWPTNSHNFPMVYKPEIQEDDNYERFEGFINNYNVTFLENEIVQEENEDGDLEDVYVNRNVMVPFPYLLEILRFGFAQEGKQITGQLVQHEDFIKALYIPDNYLERFQGSEYEQMSFTTRTGPGAFLGVTGNKYETSFTPQSTGTYTLNFKLNIPPGLAEFFQLRISRQDPSDGDLTVIKNYQSKFTRVQLDEKLTLNITAAEQFHPIVVQLYLSYTEVSILKYNTFEFSFGGGKLNIFPSTYTLADFMPDMKFGEYVNLLKNWLNLDITIKETYAKFDFLEKTVLEKERVDHSHLMDPDVTRESNNNRFYKLSYANGDQVFFNKNGQVYSDLDSKDSEEMKIEMDVQPAIVESNKNVITAVAPKDKSDLDFCIFTPRALGKPPHCKPEDSEKLSLQNVADNFWKTWLNFRINSFTFKENFECSVHESIFIENLSYKYNELHVIKKLDKKIKSEHRMEVDIESESF